jgi:AraC family transcriptional regulator, regulatory protein of adaptative response / methylated-DNA-[protein]-cysteine methyltransferase
MLRSYAALTEQNADFEWRLLCGRAHDLRILPPDLPARPPKRENCEFFADARQAMLASYRSCKRCRPLSHPNETSKIVRQLVDAIEREPEKLWRTADFAALQVHASPARRRCRKQFSVTFVEYARARRLSAAFKAIRGERVINADRGLGG